MYFLFSHIRLNGSKPPSWLKVLWWSKPLSWSSLSFHLLQNQSSHLLTSFLVSHIRLKVLSGLKPPSWSLLTFSLRFLISRSRSGTPISFLLVSFSQFGQERFSLKVLPGSQPPSWSLLNFRLQFRISRSRSGTLISFPLVSSVNSVGNGSVLKSSQGQSLHHDLCWVSIFVFRFPILFPRLTHQTQSPVRVEASIIIFANFPSSFSDFPLSVRSHFMHPIPDLLGASATARLHSPQLHEETTARRSLKLRNFVWKRARVERKITNETNTRRSTRPRKAFSAYAEAKAFLQNSSR